MKNLILLACLTLTISACKKDKKIATPAKIIGQTYQGGIIFYVDATGQHGLLASPMDQSLSAIWGCFGTDIPAAAGIAVGTGQANTTAIIKGCSEVGTAANICDDLNLGGYTDWFLPSKDEVNLMYNNLYLKNIGNLYSNKYWSSTQMSTKVAFFSFFTTDVIAAPTASDSYKSNQYHVRAVRAF